MNEEKLLKIRHTLAHILAGALQKIYKGDVKFGTGPAVDNGFYYDVSGVEIGEKDLKTIEKEMHKIVNQNTAIQQYDLPIDEAKNWAKTEAQPFKQELIEDLAKKGEKQVSFYKIGNFTDLCKGPHLAKTGEVKPKSFKLTKLSGAYWRGNEKNAQMVRIYGVAFNTAEDLQKYEVMQAEALKRDHRKLGKELDLFTFSPLVGAGLPLFTPRGTILRDKLTEYSLSLREKAGFEKVWTPHITKTDLYKTSGHWAKFGDELFLVKSQETSDEFAMKPMNCPHHTQIFASKPRSYRDMPVRYMEATTDYRDEKTGELGGLNRVRSLTQDDSHVFCRTEQIKEEVEQLVKIVQELYKTLNMDKLRARLSYRDASDKYLGEQNLWDMAQSRVKELAIENHLDYFEAEGEAAFYGPKIDFMASDALGREHQVATIQLDFVQPERFGLEYTAEDGKKETPVMIHHATLGSIERFLSVFIEHTAGHFPFWCAPEQIRILTINDTVADYVAEIEAKLRSATLELPIKHNDIRYTVDNRPESLSRKIKDATSMKIPVVFIIGEKDKASRQVSVRVDNEVHAVNFDDLTDNKYFRSHGVPK
jgi:threonyl-tRNA synthetase